RQDLAARSIAERPDKEPELGYDAMYRRAFQSLVLRRRTSSVCWVRIAIGPADIEEGPRPRSPRGVAQAGRPLCEVRNGRSHRRGEPSGNGPWVNDTISHS